MATAFPSSDSSSDEDNVEPINSKPRRKNDDDAKRKLPDVNILDDILSGVESDYITHIERLQKALPSLSTVKVLERHYQGFQFVGSGSYGDVFKTTHIESNKVFAAKKIRIKKRREGVRPVV